MAGNKINKTKGKDEKNKSNKDNEENDEEVEEPDHSLLRKPIFTSITGFKQARKIYDWATEELKHLLSHECDILYECKVCRNIFRSLANFISHKRVYCKENFNPNSHSHFGKPPSTITELLKIKRLEEEYQESLKENFNRNTDCKDDDQMIPLTKDLTDVVERIAKKNGVQNCPMEVPQTILQEIPNTSVAVYQSAKSSTVKPDVGWDKQVNELDSALVSRGVAVLQHDGNFKMNTRLSADPENVIQISDDDEENEDTSEILKCKVCDLQFSTQKTLKFHMKSKHVESRVVYPCPDCLEIFSTTWSVYRHLFKVHRKSTAQVRRQRDSIQAKAFKMNNIPAFYEKRRNTARQRAAQKLALQDKLRSVTEEERSDRENQAWMDSMEADGEGPRCGGCGRSFERRAALVAHTQVCAPRSRATKRIQIQIRRDYNKGPSLHKPLDANENKITEEVRSVPEAANTNDANSQNDDTDTEDLAELSRDSGGSDDNSKSPEKTDSSLMDENTAPDHRLMDENTARKDEPAVQDMYVVDDQAVILDEPDKPVEADDRDIFDVQEVTANEKEPVIHDMPLPLIRLPHGGIAETSNFNALRQKIEPDVDMKTLLCKKCENRCGTVQELYDHLAAHYNWKRYACKLCPFKHYTFEKLPDHVIVVHKLNGDNDFYLSTIKALDGPTALELCDNVDEHTTHEISLDSRQTSRCSSESGRLSDESSSSSTRIESGAKKRKMNQNVGSLKRKKGSPAKNIEESNNSSPAKDANVIENDTSSNVKTFEENSSDMDDLDDKIAKRQIVEDTPSMASRRPVRRKTKPKNEDFEYDLSNLLKMEAQGYRDSQTVTTTKSNQTKKKALHDNQVNYENLNKNCCGAMASLAKNAVSKSTAHMKMISYSNCLISKDQKQSKVFIRPMAPKILTNGDKTPPKKESVEDKKDTFNVNKELKNQRVNEEISKTSGKEEISDSKKDPSDSTIQLKIKSNLSTGTEPIKKNLHLPAVVPLKFPRQSLEVITNPLMNKNLKDLTKAGMKKILVIKPLNRSQDVSKGLNTPLKFQTIKLKDPNKNSSSEDKSSDQVVFVKVPNVDCPVARSSVESSAVSKGPAGNSDTSTEPVTMATEDPGELVHTLSSSSNTDSREEEIREKSSTSVNHLLFSRPSDEGDIEISSNCKTNTSTDIR